MNYLKWVISALRYALNGNIEMRCVYRSNKVYLINFLTRSRCKTSCDRANSDDKDILITICVQSFCEQNISRKTCDLPAYAKSSFRARAWPSPLCPPEVLAGAPIHRSNERNSIAIHQDSSNSNISISNEIATTRTKSPFSCGSNGDQPISADPETMFHGSARYYKYESQNYGSDVILHPIILTTTARDVTVSNPGSELRSDSGITLQIGNKPHYLLSLARLHLFEFFPRTSLTQILTSEFTVRAVTNGKEESESSSSKRESTGSTSSNGSNKERPAPRRALRPGNSSTSSNDRDDEDDENYPNKDNRKEKSNCEKSAITIVNSTHADEAEDAEPFHEMSVLGSISRVLGYARQWVSHTVPDQHANPIQSPLPSPRFTITVDFPENDPMVPTSPDMDEKYLTPHGLPGKFRTPSREKFKTHTALEVQVTPRRIRSPATPNQPQSLMRKRMKQRFEIASGNDDVRRRVVSESIQTAGSELQQPNVIEESRSLFQCIRLSEEGVHNCSTAGDSLPLHLDHSLITSSCLSVDGPQESDYSTALLDAIDHKLNSSTTRAWKIHEVDQIGKHISSDSEPWSSRAEDLLLHLLCHLNKAASESTGSAVRFTGLKIRSTGGRSTMLPILDTNSEVFCPLLLLHIGQKRKLNVIPESFLSSTRECFTVELNHFSTVIVPPKTKKMFKFSLPMENERDAPGGLDFHLLVSPFMADIEDHVEAEKDLTSLLSKLSFLDTSNEAIKPSEPSDHDSENSSLSEEPGPVDTPGQLELSLREELDNADITNEDTLVSPEQEPEATVENVARGSIEPEGDIMKNTRFLSRNICLEIINGYQGDTIKKWLRDCEQPTSGTVQNNRENLLEIIDLIHEGDIKPFPNFTKSLMSKMTNGGIEAELSLLGIEYINLKDVYEMKEALLNQIHPNEIPKGAPFHLTTTELNADPSIKAAEHAKNASEAEIVKEPQTENVPIVEQSQQIVSPQALDTENIEEPSTENKLKINQIEDSIAEQTEEVEESNDHEAENIKDPATDNKLKENNIVDPIVEQTEHVAELQALEVENSVEPVTENKLEDHSVELTDQMLEAHETDEADKILNLNDNSKASTPAIDPKLESCHFIERSLFESVVGILNAKPAAEWVKSCKRVPAATCEGNRKILLKIHEECIISGSTALNPKFIEKVTGKLKDVSVISELTRRKVTPKSSARSRKTQLQDYLIKRYANANGEAWFDGVISQIEQQTSASSSKQQKKKLRRLQRSILELDSNAGNQKVARTSAIDVDESSPISQTAKKVVPDLPPKESSSTPKPKPEPNGPCCFTQPIRTLETGLLSIQQRVSDIEETIAHTKDKELTVKFSTLEHHSDTLLTAFNEQQSVLDTLVNDVILLKSSQLQVKSTQSREKHLIDDQTKMGKLVDHNKTLETHIFDLEKRLSAIGKDNSMLTTKLSETEARFKQSSSEYEKQLQDKHLIDDQTKMGKLVDHNKTLETHISDLEKRLSAMGKENSMLTTKVSETEAIFKQSSSKYEKRLQDRHKENNELRALLLEKDSTCARLSSELENSETKKSNARLQKELAGILSKLEESNARSLAQSTEKSELYKVIVEQEIRLSRVQQAAPNSLLTTKVSETEAKLEETSSKYEKQLQDRHKENTELRALLLEKDSTCARLSSEVENSETKKSNVRLQKELAGILSKLEESDAKSLALSTEKSELHKVIVDQKIRLSRLQEVAPNPQPTPEQVIHIDNEVSSGSGIIISQSETEKNAGRDTEAIKGPTGKEKQANNYVEPSKSGKGSTTITASAKKPGASELVSKPENSAENAAPLWERDHTESEQDDSNLRTNSRMTKCLLVHDKYHRNFDKNQFRSYYDVSTLALYRTKHILQSGSMISKIKALKSESTILHVGHHDLWDGISPEDVLNDVKQIIYKVLESTNTKLCVSLVIPVTAHKHVNNRIKIYNNDLARFISTVRKNSSYRDRLYTTDNRKLTDHVTKSVGAYGSEVKLNDKGENILWLMLRDSIDRTLGKDPYHEQQRDSYRNKYANRNVSNND